MGRKSKPSAVKALHGNPGHRPLRRQPRLGAAIGNAPPSYLSDDAKAAWKRLTDKLRRAKLLDELDSELHEAYALAYAEMVAAARALRRGGLTRRDRDGRVRRSPWSLIKARAVAELQRIGAELGLGQSSRARLGEPINRSRNQTELEQEPARLPLREFIKRGETKSIH